MLLKNLYSYWLLILVDSSSINLGIITTFWEEKITQENFLNYIESSLLDAILQALIASHFSNLLHLASSLT